MPTVRERSQNRTKVGGNKASYRREVQCPNCGGIREVSDRHARRTEQATLCVACRNPSKHEPPSDNDRRFWLERFTDREIIEMTEAMTDQKASLATIQRWRRQLGVEGEGIDP